MQRAGDRTFYHSLAFWLGTAAIVTGVGCHLPDFLGARAMQYQLSGMPMSNLMYLGMGLIVAGLIATTYGLFPVRNHQAPDASAGFQLHTLDNARLSWSHWQLVIVLGVALVVDVMKPATLGFVVPGMRHEYAITKTTASLLALFAMIGTTAGSIVWGLLADWLGRRGSILLAALIFISTGICGTMPAFKWNLCMCFLMGMSAGGLLPIVFALLAEMIPARHRGWMSVLVGGLGSAGGYLAASGAAATLEPILSWRILWLLNVPTGLLVILLSRFIPESPRFLLHEGKIDEARHTLAKFGVELVPVPPRQISPDQIISRMEPPNRCAPDNTYALGAFLPLPGGEGRDEGELSNTIFPPASVYGANQETADHATEFHELFRKPYLALTGTVCLFGLAWGLVNWGFLTWLPTILRDDLHLDGQIANRLLARAALFAVPGCVLVAWLYGFWSSKKTMILFALITASVLGAFAAFKPGGSPGLFSLLTVLLLMGLSGMIAMLSPYSAELYPTKLRATAPGVTASSSKMGGVVGPSAVACILSAFPGLAIPALSLAVPLVVAAFALWLNGRETSGKGLEEIQRNR